MLEKIGLPAKPSQRGNNWVVDASHCQGCSSQFTFINRKHHCRRCGGLFCNSCTQQRMVLRGQGDSPVRICEPCKKLEEAARFEMRYGHRNRAGRGKTKSTLESEDEVLNQILGDDRKEAFASGLGSSSKTSSNIQGASSFNAQEVVALGEGSEARRSPSTDDRFNTMGEMGTASPEDLRQKALEEKKKYKVLKGEGKSDEALRAFKRGKELERQADALELTLRRNCRKASLSASVEEVQTKDVPGESRSRSKVARLESKEKNDLTAELRELGWSDMDLHNEDKKGTNMTLEGELSFLLAEISDRPKNVKGTNAIDKTQVIAHKKRALLLKREGKMAEAKEELKRAKVLEKQLEEQELLAEAEEDDDDDELSELIHSMNSDKNELSSNLYEQQHDFDFGSLLGAAGDQIIDSNFDVTDEDMEDPEIAAALKSLGWTEDSDNPKTTVTQIVSVDKESLSKEILSLKREAVNQKQAGNVSEAMALLKKAKLLERDLESFESHEGKVGIDSDSVQMDPTSQAASKSSKSSVVSDENINATKERDSKFSPRSKLMIQKELLGLKKKALALRREGRLDEAEEELKKGKILEHQLEEMDRAMNVKVEPVAARNKDPKKGYKHPDFSNKVPIVDEEGDDVTDQDMHDPAYLSLLKDLGWKDEQNDQANSLSESHDRYVNIPEHIDETSVPQATPVVPVRRLRSRAEMQKELLGLKRKALVLRRQGESEDAEEVLRMAKDLEVQMAEMEQPIKEVQLDLGTHKANAIKSLKSADEEDDAGVITEKDMCDPEMLSMLKNSGRNEEEHETKIMHAKEKETAVNSVHSDAVSLIQPSLPIVVPAKRSKGEIQRELLNLKRKAFTLRRKGETEEAEEVLKMAKVLEAQMEELEVPKQAHLHEVFKDEKPDSFGSLINQERHENLAGIAGISGGMSQATSITTSKLIEFSSDVESMGSDTARHTSRNSDLPIPLNSQLIEGDQMIESTSIPPPGDSVNLVDLLTGDDWRGPQMSAEQQDMALIDEKPHVQASNSVKETPTVRNDDVKTEKQENMVLVDEKQHDYEANSTEENASPSNESALKQDVLARKRKAVALKREGKLAEAREELRQAKLLEKRLEKDDDKAKTSPAKESDSTSNVSSVGQKERGSSNTPPKSISSRDRFKLQQESLAHKRQALKLRREGRTEEAEAEFELAKALETQLEELSAQDSVEPENDVGVEDFLDPQLLSALKAIGIEDANVVPRVADKPQSSKPNVGKIESPNQERIKLEEQIKAEKVKALNLKRSGKQAEALDALRKAKLLEKKLNSLS
ncbi:Vacuolar protein sorting-associated protein 27 [Morus notabilis]|uniref:Vacuolar protein sorting-associated protein 27 n=1 Tax=Morus notabilis TaxID=981085 RepID=W9RZC2_9ROSA|nr:uncharacterized protein LOC21386709 [Morus notabilis]EXC04602.1 Vacuolar protein sorting-associated protein 27 [Morus notabilis]